MSIIYVACKNKPSINLFYPPYFAAHQPHLDAVRMHGAFGEDIADDAVGQTAGVLILFQNDGDAEAASDIFALFRVRHWFSPFRKQCAIVIKRLFFKHFFIFPALS